jgi:hypothetical protein
MAVSTQVKNFAGAVVRFADGTTPTPVTIVLALFQGTLTLGPLSEYLNEDVIFSATTQFAGLGVGAPVYPEISLEALTYNIIGDDEAAVTGTPFEFVHAQGAYDANVSTLGANRLITVDVRTTIEGTRWGDSADEMIDCEDVRFTQQFSMGAEGNRIAYTGQVLGSIVITNDTNVVTLTRL